jgi:RNA polymerase sigma factor (sigma-70 family)
MECPRQRSILKTNVVRRVVSSGLLPLTDNSTAILSLNCHVLSGKVQPPSPSDGHTVKNRSAGQGDVTDATSTPVYEAYTQHGSSLRRFIGRFMRGTSDIEDIAQEAFLRAYVAERGRPIEQPKSFLFRIAKHLALSQLTRKSRQITEYIEDSDDSSVIQLDHSAEDEVSARQMLGLHCEAVAELAPQCRQVYLLRKVHGFSHKEISEHLGIAVSTVEKHLMKAVELCDRYVRERSELRASQTDARLSQEVAGGRK